MAGGQIGLAIFSSIGLIAIFQLGMRRSAELESQMTSVERIVEYAELPSEPPLDSTEKNAPPEDWPQHGNIEFKSLSMRYAEHSARALRNVTFQIDAKVDAILNTHSNVHISLFIVVSSFFDCSKRLES